MRARTVLTHTGSRAQASGQTPEDAAEIHFDALKALFLHLTKLEEDQVTGRGDRKKERSGAFQHAIACCQSELRTSAGVGGVG